MCLDRNNSQNNAGSDDVRLNVESPAPLGRAAIYFDKDALSKDLKGKTVRGGAVTAIAQFVRIAINLISIPILSRLLTPEDFGLVAMVTVVTGFAAMFVDAGLSMATVQRDEITHRQVSNLFWLAALLGTLLALLVSAFSPLIAWFYGEPRLVGITLALAGSFMLSGLTIQHQALLRRTMQLNSLAIIQIASMFAAQGITILLAWQYRNYWALVAMPLVAALTQLTGAWLACPWRPSLPRRGSGVRPMVAFGANLTGFNFANYFSRNADNILIGSYWGATPLGFYERAYKLLLFPLQLINAPLSSVAIPVLSRLADKPDRYRKAYLRFLEFVLIITVPLAAFLLVSHDWCIDLALGSQWAEAAPIFGWLAIAAFTQPLGNTTGWLFISQGRGQELFRWGLLSGVITIVSFLAGLAWGPIAVAASYALVGLLVRTPLLLYFATRKGPIRISDFLHTLRLPSILGVVIAGCLLLNRFAYPTLSSTTGTLLSIGLATICWFLVMASINQGRTLLAMCYVHLAQSLNLKHKTT